MREILAFLYRTRVLLVFLLLEAVAGLLIVNFNSYQGAVYLSSANQVASSMYATRTEVIDFVNLRSVNEELMQENAALRESLREHSRLQSQANLDSFAVRAPLRSDFAFISAEVVNNSVLRPNNYLTINKGSKDGIRPGMGIVTSQGVVGQVKLVSDHYATCYSVLHSNMAISSQIKKDSTLCTVKWDTQDPEYASIHYLQRHLNIKKGDSVVTSGYNAIYPEGTLVGTVSSVVKDPSERFLTVKLKMSVDYRRLSFVYVANSLFKDEREALERQSMVE